MSNVTCYKFSSLIFLILFCQRSETGWLTVYYQQGYPVKLILNAQNHFFCSSKSQTNLRLGDYLSLVFGYVITSPEPLNENQAIATDSHL